MLSASVVPVVVGASGVHDPLLGEPGEILTEARGDESGEFLGRGEIVTKRGAIVLRAPRRRHRHPADGAACAPPTRPSVVDGVRIEDGAGRVDPARGTPRSPDWRACRAFIRLPVRGHRAPGPILVIERLGVGREPFVQPDVVPGLAGDFVAPPLVRELVGHDVAVVVDLPHAAEGLMLHVGRQAAGAARLHHAVLLGDPRVLAEEPRERLEHARQLVAAGLVRRQAARPLRSPSGPGRSSRSTGMTLGEAADRRSRTEARSAGSSRWPARPGTEPSGRLSCQRYLVRPPERATSVPSSSPFESATKPDGTVTWVCIVALSSRASLQGHQ